MTRQEYSKTYYLKHKDKVKEKNQVYRISNKEALRLKAKERNTPSYLKNLHLKSNYGIDLDTYNRMFAEQEGCCDLCGKHQSDFKLSLAVDHCHKTNRVRSLLCPNCNSGLGNLRDSKEMLLKAIKYLERHEND